MDYSKITELKNECCCCNISQYKWDILMNNAVRADKKKINRLVKKLLPNLYYELRLNFHNPYNYFRTKTHLILVHSSIEYSLRYNYDR